MSAPHQIGCAWNPEDEHCTCGAIYLTRVYRFANGNIMAFDQFGHQMPYYQESGYALERIHQDYPHIHIMPGEVRNGH